MSESEYWTHHGYAVNVKDRTTIHDWERAVDGLGELDESEVEVIYERNREAFWMDAEMVTKDFRRVYGSHWPKGGGGYRTTFDGCWAEGRSGGWLVPYPQPSTDDMSELDVSKFERDFASFAQEIGQLVESQREMFLDELREEIEDKRTTNRHNRLAAADWRY